jgi:predicted O-methyltransferase YrrM
MKLLDKIIVKIFKLGAKKYWNIKENHLNKLPNIPSFAVPIAKYTTELQMKEISKKFEPEIQDELLFYGKHHFELEDLQTGDHIGNFCQFIKETERLEGNILELGTYKGGSTVMLARFLKKINSKRKIFACDAFLGYPYEDKFSTQKNAKGTISDTSFEDVLKKFKKFNVDDKITIVKGLFEETLEKKLSNEKFSLVLIDCDLYDSVKFCLKFTYPRIVDDGLLIFDNYSLIGNKAEEKIKNLSDRNTSNLSEIFPDETAWGEVKAVDEFCSEEKIKLDLKPMPHIKK